MSDLKKRVRRLVKINGYLLVLFALGWGVTPYRTIFAGLFLGAFVSLLNVLYTAVKSRQFGLRMAAGLRPKGSGMLTRLSMVALAALLAIHYSEFIHIYSFLIGLTLLPISFFLDGLVDLYRFRNAGVERGGE